MSVIRTILGRACSQFSSLTAPKTSGMLGMSKAQFSDSRDFKHTSKSAKKEMYRKTIQLDETGQETSIPKAMKLEMEKVRQNDLRPGYGNFPTAEIYEQTFDGVRYDELPTVHITCTRNNTLGYATRGKLGEFVVTRKTGGSVGFKNARKSSNVAAQSVGQQLGQVLVKRKLTNVRVEFDGTGIHRMTALRGLMLSGVNIISISDRMYPNFNNRPRKQRRI